MEENELSELVLTWMSAVEEQQSLGGGRRRYSLLRYLIKEEFEGRGSQIKGYSIALDVFDRTSDFDASADSIVRVEMRRLRDALKLYYANPDNHSQPKIEIPKGSYRPQITLPQASLAEQPGAAPASGTWQPLAFVAAIVLVAATSLTLFFLREGPKTDVQSVPVLAVSMLSDMSPETGNDFAIGFRQQLVTDLSHLPTISVRDGQMDVNAIGRDVVAPPDYRLDLIETGGDDAGLLSLKLTSNSENLLVWARTIEIDLETDTFYQNIANSVRGIGQEIAGPAGAITADQARFVLNAANEDQTTRREYQCLILSLFYDATKSPSAKEQSRDCLERAIANNTGNASLRAEYALRLFLDSGGISDSREFEEILVEAERQARLAITLNPFDAIAYEVLGNIESASNKRDAAIANYMRAIELAPSRPAPHFLLGWQTVLQGDWDAGMESINAGLNMQPNVPGYMIVPLALNAFRVSEYEQSLKFAEAIIARGDQRGYALAFSASLALGDLEKANAFFSHPDARTRLDPTDPMREVRHTFSNPDVLRKYDEIIAKFQPS